ncbi:CaiB/BaiF CoA-transferase family protein [uncultured Anaerococcus sp.]|uniref:CaiB/BaiF CoA transferase family protein n=1 Tax=uncultured Anaerococcus sp. TaxID=293428 RepID=UPI002803C407|nr:CaiB/BaiF CoA-transferase family protein [uncultured Anaerococcus sp.]
MNLLTDLKILDFTTLLPGPYATWMLSEMGAHILKISAPGRKDLVLDSEPKTQNGLSANRAWLNNKKKEIFLNLKEEAGKKEIIRLIKEEGYNCIIEQFRPGVMAKFGLDYEDIKEIQDDIIYLSLTGYGQDGPYKYKAGHDINYLALSGLMSYSGRKETGPVLYGMQIADIASAQNSVIGILAALNKRNETGLGTYIDVSILDSVIPFNAMAGVGAMMSGNNPKREEDFLNGGSLYDFYQTKDNKYLSFGGLEPKFFERFCKIIGKEEWVEKGCVCPDFKEKKEVLRKIFKKKTRDEWTLIFKDADCCVEPVLDLKEALLEDKNTKIRKSINIIDIDGEQIKVYSNPIKFE